MPPKKYNDYTDDDDDDDKYSFLLNYNDDDLGYYEKPDYADWSQSKAKTVPKERKKQPVGATASAASRRQPRRPTKQDVKPDKFKEEEDSDDYDTLVRERSDRPRTKQAVRQTAKKPMVYGAANGIIPGRSDRLQTKQSTTLKPTQTTATRKKRLDMTPDKQRDSRKIGIMTANRDQTIIKIENILSALLRALCINIPHRIIYEALSCTVDLDAVQYITEKLNKGYMFRAYPRISCHDIAQTIGGMLNNDAQFLYNKIFLTNKPILEELVVPSRKSNITQMKLSLSKTFKNSKLPKNIELSFTEADFKFDADDDIKFITANSVAESMKSVNEKASKEKINFDTFNVKNSNDIWHGYTKPLYDKFVPAVKKEKLEFYNEVTVNYGMMRGRIDVLAKGPMTNGREVFVISENIGSLAPKGLYKKRDDNVADLRDKDCRLQVLAYNHILTNIINVLDLPETMYPEMYIVFRDFQMYRTPDEVHVATINVDDIYDKSFKNINDMISKNFVAAVLNVLCIAYNLESQFEH